MYLQDIAKKLSKKQEEIRTLEKDVTSVKEKFPKANTAGLQRALDDVRNQHYRTQESCPKVTDVCSDIRFSLT